jgi:hypothetical protein
VPCRLRVHTETLADVFSCMTIRKSLFDFPLQVSGKVDRESLNVNSG